MDIIYWAILGIGAFVAIWMLFVAPAERRHHKRKLEMLQKKIEARQAGNDQSHSDSSTDQSDELGES